MFHIQGWKSSFIVAEAGCEGGGSWYNSSNFLLLINFAVDNYYPKFIVLWAGGEVIGFFGF